MSTTKAFIGLAVTAVIAFLLLLVYPNSYHADTNHLNTASYVIGAIALLAAGYFAYQGLAGFRQRKSENLDR